MSSAKKIIDTFVNVAVYQINNVMQKQTPNKNTNPTQTPKNGFIGTTLTNYGKELDENINKFSFLYDDEYTYPEQKKVNIINETNMVFNKSQLSPDQLNQMFLQKNVYIENAKSGDWVQYNINGIEEGLQNIKDKNKQDSMNSVSYLTTIKAKIPRNN